METWTLVRKAALRPDLAVQLAAEIVDAQRRGRVGWPLARAG